MTTRVMFMSNKMKKKKHLINNVINELEEITAARRPIKTIVLGV